METKKSIEWQDLSENSFGGIKQKTGSRTLLITGRDESYAINKDINPGIRNRGGERFQDVSQSKSFFRGYGTR